eukprot:6185696-Pleurochrysis_carterae.AAC.2
MPCQQNQSDNNSDGMRMEDFRVAAELKYAMRAYATVSLIGRFAAASIKTGESLAVAPRRSR